MISKDVLAKTIRQDLVDRIPPMGDEWTFLARQYILMLQNRKIVVALGSKGEGLKIKSWSKIPADPDTNFNFTPDGEMHDMQEGGSEMNENELLSLLGQLAQSLSIRV